MKVDENESADEIASGYESNNSGGEKSEDDLSGSDHVRVVIRCRPLNVQKEKDGSSEVSLFPDGKSVQVLTKGSKKSYKFLCVADPSRDQEYIFRKTGKHVVECALSGFNGAIVAYGQTGSGKTYTMQGPGLAACDTQRNQSKGIIQKVCETIFAHKTEQEAFSTSITYSIKAEYLEIYNELVIDLLSQDCPRTGARKIPRKQQKVGIFEDAKGTIIVQNQTTVVVNSPEECYKLLREGGTRRSVGATNMNSESSRSHAIFTLKIEKSDDEKGIKRTSKLHLVDLAGSERQKGTGATGVRLREAGGINKSLSALGNVINALAEREGARLRGERPGRIPSYRDSKLTFLLKDSFGGNSKLCLIATISPALGYADETANTLEFAKRCCSVRNEAVVNEHLSEDIAKLQAEVRRLEKSNRQLKFNLAKAKNTELELRASANVVQTVPVHVRAGESKNSRKTVTKDVGVQTEASTGPFNEGKNIMQSVKTKDLTSALDSLVARRLESEDKESRTEKLCVLLTNAISRERYHQRKEEEMKRKIVDSHQRWIEMLESNEKLVSSLKERDKTVQEIVNADLADVENSKSRRIEQEMELLKVQVTSNPEVILLRHRVAALESELEVSNASGGLTGEARLVYEGKLQEMQARWTDMLNVNEDLVSSLARAEDELDEIRQHGLEKVYSSDGRKLKAELERMRKAKRKDPEKEVLRNKAKALEMELVEFAEISLAAQKEAYAQASPQREVATNFSTDLADLDDNIGNSSDDSNGLENKPQLANDSRKARKNGRRPRRFFSRRDEKSTRNSPDLLNLVTTTEAWVEGLRALDCEGADNISPEQFSYCAPRPRSHNRDIPEALKPLDTSLRDLEGWISRICFKSPQ